MTARLSRWALAREILSVFLIGLGVPTLVVLSVLDGNLWLVGTEVLVALGVALGMKRARPDEADQPPAEPRDVQVTVIEHEK